MKKTYFYRKPILFYWTFELSPFFLLVVSGSYQISTRRKENDVEEEGTNTVLVVV